MSEKKAEEKRPVLLYSWEKEERPSGHAIR